MNQNAREYLEVAWEALAGQSPSQVEVRNHGRYFESPFDLDGAAIGAVAATLLAGAELAEARGATRPSVSLDAAHIALAFQSERLMRTDPPVDPTFPALSSFARASDGHIRLHAHYPQHRAALMRALGNPPDEQAALAAVESWDAESLEQAVVDAGGAASAVRSAAQWLEHPQATATQRLRVVDCELADSAAPPLGPADGLPCSGLRVLDLTRALAGPVATRMLGALGADVLRIDSPSRPELDLNWFDGAVGKKSAFLDLHTNSGRSQLERLLARADVLVQGYRPGALTRLGLDASSLSTRHPHLVTVSLSAWGELGPWAERRGFDSLVQAAVGIAIACGSAHQPRALPVQALDHASGYLIAAAALRGLTRRQTTGHAAHAKVSLTQTANWIVRRPAAKTAPVPPPRHDHSWVEVPSPRGALRCLRPPGSLDGVELVWPSGVPTAGTHPPAW